MARFQKKILITGANGFIGRNFVKNYAKALKQHKTLLLVHKHGFKTRFSREASGLLSNGSPTEELVIKGLEKFGFKILEVDLVRKESLNLLRNESFDLVIHLAASTDTSKKDHRVNFEGTKNLIKTISLSPRTHIIYTSTVAIFSGRKDCSIPVSDETVPLPSNEYGRSKFKTENYLKSLSKKRKSRLTILRLSTVYGKETRNNGLFGVLRKSIKNHGLISRLNWPGLASFIHVDDVSDVIWEMGNDKTKTGEVKTYLVYSDSHSISEISQKMHEALKYPYKEIKLPEFVWKIVASIRNYFPYLEKLMSQQLYNYFWRSSLIVDNALWCQTNGLHKRIRGWDPEEFNNKVKDVVS